MFKKIFASVAFLFLGVLTSCSSSSSSAHAKAESHTLTTPYEMVDVSV